MGKTALVLGGGGSRGAYEIGVWQALKELGIKIDIVTGTSIGAVNGALVAQDCFETALEIWQKLKAGTVSELTEKEVLRTLLEENIDEKKIRESNIDFGIVTVELPGLKEHCVFKEDIEEGEMADYIMASAACFPFVEPHEIGEKKFIDGAYFDNVPVEMAVKRGAECVIAVDLESVGITRKAAFEEAADLKLISCKWELGSFFKFEPENIKRVIRLGYLDTMKAYGAFSGERYTFIKGEFAKRGLAEAEAAAGLFGCDPAVIYSKEILDKNIREAMESEEERGWAEELRYNLKEKLKRLASEGPRKLLREELLAKRYLEKNGVVVK